MALNKGYIRNATTDAIDARLMDAAKIIRRVDGTPIGGVLSTPQTDGGVVSGTSGMSVNIADGSAYAITRSPSDGVVLLTNVGIVSLNVPVPTANSQISLIYVKHSDSTQGDSDNLAFFGIVTGSAAASPTAPALPTGAQSLAQITVQAGATSTNGSSVTISHTFAFTTTIGGILRYRSATTMQNQLSSLPNGTLGQVDFTTGSSGVYVVRNGNWLPISADVFAVVEGTGTQTSGTTLATLNGSPSLFYSSDSSLIATRSDLVIGITVAGWYEVTGAVQWTSTGNGNRYIAITRNDNELTPTIGTRTVSQGQAPQTTTGMMLLAAGDLVKLKGWQDSNSTLTYNTRLTARLLRAA